MKIWDTVSVSTALLYLHISILRIHLISDQICVYSKTMKPHLNELAILNIPLLHETVSHLAYHNKHS